MAPRPLLRKSWAPCSLAPWRLWTSVVPDLDVSILVPDWRDISLCCRRTSTAPPIYFKYICTYTEKRVPSFEPHSAPTPPCVSHCKKRVSTMVEYHSRSGRTKCISIYGDYNFRMTKFEFKDISQCYWQLQAREQLQCGHGWRNEGVTLII
ncbi:hypothetical protein DFH27DRAFT_527451 [Peziza echinospora]|nr:hypothetical protein DFH27DRAFT_527451 [Peziza echinospora]